MGISQDDYETVGKALLQSETSESVLMTLQPSNITPRSYQTMTTLEHCRLSASAAKRFPPFALSRTCIS